MYELTARWSKPPLSSVTAPGTQSAPLLLLTDAHQLHSNSKAQQKTIHSAATSVNCQTGTKAYRPLTAGYQNPPLLGAPNHLLCSDTLSPTPSLSSPALNKAEFLQVKKAPPPHPTVYLWDRINFLGNLNRISCNLNSWTFKFTKEVTKFTF